MAARVERGGSVVLASFVVSTELGTWGTLARLKVFVAPDLKFLKVPPGTFEMLPVCAGVAAYVHALLSMKRSVQRPYVTRTLA